MKTINMKIVLGTVVLGFVGFLGFLMLSLNNNPSILPSVLEGKKIPAFQMPSLENPNEMLTDKSIQGPALINIWATWCPTCRSEHEKLNSLAKEGIKIYGINYKDEPEKARAWLAELGNPYLFNINDEKGQLGIDLGVYGAPETFFIDAEGKIILRHVGDINDTNWHDSLLPVWQSMNGIKITPESTQKSTLQKMGLKQ